MTILGLRILLVLSLLFGFTTPDLVSAATINQPPSLNLLTEQWAGRSFTFLALPAAKQTAGYEIFKVDQAAKAFEGDASLRISYEEHVGKQVTVNQIVTFPAGANLKESLVYMTVNTTGEKLVGKTMREQLEGLVLTADLQNARKQFLGKKIYPKSRVLSGLYIPKINEAPLPVTIPIASAVTVVDVYAGNQAQEPIWLIVAVNGEKAMLPISYSWTNMLLSEWTQTPAWQTSLFMEDPRLTFQWSQDVWDNIEKGNVEIGMLKDQIRLSWGKPLDTNEKNNIWIYGSQKLKFTGDVLYAIEAIQ